MSLYIFVALNVSYLLCSVNVSTAYFGIHDRNVSIAVSSYKCTSIPLPNHVLAMTIDLIIYDRFTINATIGLVTVNGLILQTVIPN